MRRAISTITEATDVLSEIRGLFLWASKVKWLDYETYFKNIIYNTSQFRYLYTSYKGEHGKIDGFENLAVGITNDIVNLIHKEWENITDAEIKKSDAIKRCFYAIKTDFTRGNTPITSTAVTSVKKQYDTYFKDRVDWDRFVKILNAAFISQLSREMKKTDPMFKKMSKKDFDYIITQIVYKLFAGTDLEVKGTKPPKDPKSKSVKKISGVQW